MPSKRPKISQLEEIPGHEHDRHHVLKTDEVASDAFDSMRKKTIANQRDILAKSKEAFKNEVKKILDAMSSPDDLGSIDAVIADSEFNVHLDAALAAAEAIIDMRPPV